MGDGGWGMKDGGWGMKDGGWGASQIIRPLAKVAPDGQDDHPTKVIFSCGVGVSPAQEFEFSKKCNT
jgi:hypothetical protein